MTRIFRFGIPALLAVLVIIVVVLLLWPSDEQQAVNTVQPTQNSSPQTSAPNSGGPMTKFDWDRKADLNGDGVICLVLDPGHGGHDPGTMDGDLQEKNITLSIAMTVRELLEEQDWLKIVMTREDDSYPSLSERAELANTQNADLFVSIHVNALENNDTYEGIITFYHPQKSFSRGLAESIQQAIVAASGGVDREVQTENYMVLRDTEMPGVLIETGFITTPSERVRLADPAYQALLAQGIVDGILNYLRK